MKNPQNSPEQKAENKTFLSLGSFKQEDIEVLKSSNINAYNALRVIQLEREQKESITFIQKITKDLNKQEK